MRLHSFSDFLFYNLVISVLLQFLSKVQKLNMNNFKLSERGYSHLMKFEGLRTKAYKLSGENFYTIGYGHHSADIKPNEVWTESYAEMILKKDVQTFENQINNALNYDKIEATQGQFDALVCLLFNLKGVKKNGVFIPAISRLTGWHLWQKLKTGDIKGAANEFLDIIGSASPKFAVGLKNRRIAESQMFLS